MNKTFIFVIGAGIGAAVGVFGTQQYFRYKYEELYKRDIEEVKATLAMRPDVKADVDISEKNEEKTEWDNAKIEYHNIAAESGYVEPDESFNRHTDAGDPYTIPPELFGEATSNGIEYQMLSLTYYSDGILADDDNLKIMDIDNIVGAENLEEFTKYEFMDVLYIRNDRLRHDYEVCRDLRTYNESVEIEPYKRDVE